MAKVCLEEQIYLILNSHHLGESVNKFSGIHLTSVDSSKENSRYITGDNLLRISCHSEEDIMKAESLKADYIFLSPIKETNSHKELEGIGWDRFYQLSKKTSLPAYALL